MRNTHTGHLGPGSGPGGVPARADHRDARHGVPGAVTWAVVGEAPPWLLAAGDEASVKPRWGGTPGAAAEPRRRSRA
jgi:hypothetical protein